ncbi:hypothetical protein DFQ27_001370 [Actinomortierella ambigua]|uniref:Transmembrane protein n=1 Tax=Actinomortierella ambigua TaxID=1343610 RepID=A0A9P6QCE2_9FUNG|nr:hypothetical protein DFQ27_001370 [Actinomortierella ambigua]
MTSLKLDCLAKDETTMTLYGLAAAMAAGQKEQLILVKSNSRPLSVDNIVWQVVSAVDREKVPHMFSQQAGGITTCAVDPTGVFVALSPDAGMAPPGGIRFNPPANSTVSGEWRNITMASNYMWSPTKMRSIIFPVPESTPPNKYSFVHVFMSPSSEIRFGFLVASSGWQFELLDAVWKTVAARSMAIYSSGQLFTIHSDIATGARIEMTPITSTNIPASPTPNKNTPLPESCVSTIDTLRVTLSNNRLAIVCKMKRPATSVLYRYNGNVFESATQINKAFASYVVSEALEGVNGQAPFIFLQDSSDNNLPTLSINLDTRMAGEISTSSARASVPYTYDSSARWANDPDAPPPRDAPSEGIQPGTIGAIVGGVVGLVTVSLILIQWHRKRKIRAAQNAQFKEQKIPPVDPAGMDETNSFPPNKQFTAGAGIGAYPAPALPAMGTHPRPHVYTSLAGSSQPGGEPEAILGHDPSAVPLPPGAAIPLQPPRQHNDEAWLNKVPYYASGQPPTGSTVSLANPQVIPASSAAPFEHDDPMAIHAAILAAAAAQQPSLFMAPNHLGSTPSTTHLAPQAFTATHLPSPPSPPRPPASGVASVDTPVSYHPAAAPIPSSGSSSPNTKPNTPTAMATKIPTHSPPPYPALTRPPPNNPHAYIEPQPPQRPAGAAAGTSYAEFHDDDGDVPLLPYQRPPPPVPQQQQQQQQQQAQPSYDMSGSGSTYSPTTTYAASPVQSSTGTLTSQDAAWSPIVPNHTRPARHPQQR